MKAKSKKSLLLFHFIQKSLNILCRIIPVQCHTQAAGVIHHVYFGSFKRGVKGIGVFGLDGEDATEVTLALGGHGRVTKVT